MVALKIQQQKAFMAKLLTTNLFDDFLLVEATLDTFNTFHIDGLIHKDFYSSESGITAPTDKYSKWSTIRPIALDLIKGKNTPLGFKFILQLDEARKSKLLSDVESDIPSDQLELGLNIRFSSGEVILTTGVSYSIFSLDKSAEKAWDEYIPSLIDSFDIANEPL